MVSKKHGFTLIELLVVIAIIGLLSSIVFASLGSARGKARIASAQESMRNITTSAMLCLDGGYTVNAPTEAGGAVAYVCNNQTEVKTVYAPLPTNWLYCDTAAATGCTAVSVITSPLTLIARSVTDNTTVTCSESACTQSAAAAW